MTLTRREGETYAAYIDRVAASGALATRVKLADLRDNVARTKADESGRYDRLLPRYRRALEVLWLAAEEQEANRNPR